ncbi:MAG: MFS transporter [Bacteroidales bacterium]|nr:MFS transporter [Bacteroidales bacterium]
MVQRIFSIDNRIRLLNILVYATSVSWGPTLSLFLIKNGIPGWQTGIITGIFPFVSLFVLPMWGYTADRFGKQKLMLVGSMVVTVGFILYRNGQSFWMLTSITVGWTLFMV